MYNIIPFILILISLAVIITIVIRKFSVLAALDIETVQAEREIKFKEQIIGNRIKRNFFKYYAKIARLIAPIGGAISNFFKWFYQKLLDFKENYNKEKTGIILDQSKIDKLFLEAEELIKSEDFTNAEKKYIEIIGSDPKSIKAFRLLGKLYFERKDFNEAKQTFEHVLRLCEKDVDDAVKKGEINEQNVEMQNILASTYFDIALVCRSIDNFEGALKYSNRALSIEPNNPRYLDTKLEISIIIKDKISALDAYEKLSQANPENQKLAEIKAKIGEL
jgi:tetratricopeptide (TPR) repeat protein